MCPLGPHVPHGRGMGPGPRTCRMRGGMGGAWGPGAGQPSPPPGLVNQPPGAAQPPPRAYQPPGAAQYPLPPAPQMGAGGG